MGNAIKFNILNIFSHITNFFKTTMPKCIRTANRLRIVEIQISKSKDNILIRTEIPGKRLYPIYDLNDFAIDDNLIKLFSEHDQILLEQITSNPSAWLGYISHENDKYELISITVDHKTRERFLSIKIINGDDISYKHISVQELMSNKHELLKFNKNDVYTLAFTAGSEFSSNEPE